MPLLVLTFLFLFWQPLVLEIMSVDWILIVCFQIFLFVESFYQVS